MLILDLSDDNLRVEVHSSLILRSWLPLGGLVITWSPSTNWSVSIAAQGLLEKLSVTDILWSDAHTHTHTYTLVKTFFGSYCTILWKPQTFWNSGDMRFLRRIGRLDSPREWKRGASEFPYYSHTAGVWVGLVLASPGQLPSWPPWSPPPSRHLEQVHNLSTSATRHLAQVLCHHNLPSKWALFSVHIIECSTIATLHLAQVFCHHDPGPSFRRSPFCKKIVVLIFLLFFGRDLCFQTGPGSLHQN